MWTNSRTWYIICIAGTQWFQDQLMVYKYVLATSVVIPQCTRICGQEAHWNLWLGSAYCGQAVHSQSCEASMIAVRQTLWESTYMYVLWSAAVLWMYKAPCQINSALHYEFCEAMPIVITPSPYHLPPKIGFTQSIACIIWSGSVLPILWGSIYRTLQVTYQWK